MDTAVISAITAGLVTVIATAGKVLIQYAQTNRYRSRDLERLAAIEQATHTISSKIDRLPCNRGECPIQEKGGEATNA